ncbi:hypothetical protein DIPPA_09312 [Diplonema papillatum]|nr:hypothetical protein DIPPA_09312 [Diplonema papillatum]
MSALQLGRLVGAGAPAFPHAVVHGKLSDRFFVAYKPASIPLLSDEIGGDSLSARLTRNRATLHYPLPLEVEEEGLQIATASPSLSRFVEKAHRRNLVSFRYSALCDLPRCLQSGAAAAAGGCHRLKPFLKSGSPYGTLRAERTRSTSSLPQGPELDRLFANASDPADETATQGSCGGGVCVGCSYYGAGRSVKLEPDEDVVADVSAVKAYEKHSCFGVKSKATGVEVRRLLAANGLPVARDWRFNGGYEWNTAEARQLLLGSGGGMEDGAASMGFDGFGHHLSTLRDPTAIGTGFARITLVLPDPGNKRNWDLLYMKADGGLPHADDLAPAQFRYLSVSVPQPPAWEEYVHGDIIDRSLQWAVQGVSSRYREAEAPADEPAEWTPAHARPHAGGREGRSPSDVVQAEGGCAFCCSAGHSVEHCPQLNGGSKADRKNDELRGMLFRRSGAAGSKEPRASGLYCILCASEQHELLSCSRRKQGVDPKTHCCFCGSLYHTVMDCQQAHNSGLASKAGADAFASKQGFASYSELDAYKRAALRVQTKGIRPSFTQTQSILQHKAVSADTDAVAGAVEEGTMLPTGDVTHRMSLDDAGFINARAMRRKKWMAHNFNTVLSQRRDERRQQRDDRADFAKQAGGADFSSFDYV